MRLLKPIWQWLRWRAGYAHTWVEHDTDPKNLNGWYIVEWDTDGFSFDEVGPYDTWWEAWGLA